MSDLDRIELFILKCAVVESVVVSTANSSNYEGVSPASEFLDEKLESYIKQFDLVNRSNARRMSEYYRVFYMLENDIRRLISDTLEASHGVGWWAKTVPGHVRDEAGRNKLREEQAGVTFRSDSEIEYTTFGQLSDIIKENWSDFAGMMSNLSAVIRVLSGLNMLRGTIAHCGVLAEDEVDRLKLAIKDWFRVLEGPK